MAETQQMDRARTDQDGNGSTSGNAVARTNSALITDRGKTTMADSVIAKIAGVAAREIDGVHEMGNGTARAFGAIRDRVTSSQHSGITQGVDVEVGERQAAIDLDIVVDFGVSIVDVSHAVRNNVAKRVEKMTGLEVTEVNIAVDDVWLGEDENENENPQRVQ